jgi:hypothetical protein
VSLIHRTIRPAAFTAVIAVGLWTALATSPPCDGPTDPGCESSPVQLEITTATLPSAAVGMAYDARLTAQGGAGSYEWNVVSGELPSGLSLSINGQISGTPTKVETKNFVAGVADNNSQVTKEISLSVTAPPGE